MKFYFIYYAYETGIRADIGGFRKLWELAQRLERQGQKVRIFFPRISGYKPLRQIPHTSYPVLNFPLMRPLSAHFLSFFYTLIKGFREKPDIVYFRTCPNIFFVILGKLLGSKIVLEVNANFREFHKTIKVSIFRSFLFSITEKFNVTFSNKIVVLTSGLKEYLSKQYKVDLKRIEVIPSGTDIDHFHSRDSKKAKRMIGLNIDKPVIGFAGIFYPHQGLSTLIKAAKQILASYPGTVFLIVGSGMMEKSWKALVKSEGLKGSFIFTGQVVYEKMPFYFSAMDIFVAPFTAHRGQTSPLKVLDAMACGKVVVASAIDSMKLLEIECDGAFVTFMPDKPFDLAKVIIDLLSNKRLRNSLAKKARKVIEKNYSWEQIAQKTIRFLKVD